MSFVRLNKIIVGEHWIEAESCNQIIDQFYEQCAFYQGF